MAQQTVLVVGATGNQGSEVTKQLLSAGCKVHGLTRDVNSPKSQELHFAGAQMFPGSPDDSSLMKRAAEGCTALFLVILPGPSELNVARTCIEAATGAGITKCVYSSVINCDEIVARADFEESITRASYFLNKKATQDMVRSRFASWTILQPGSFMSNLVDPVARFFFSRLGSEHVLHGRWKLSTKMGFIDTVYIGKFAVAEFARVMSKVSGQSITAEYVEDEAVQAQKDNNPLVTSADWFNRGWFDVDTTWVDDLGLEMNTVEQFLERQRESGLLEQTLQKA